MTSRAIYFQRRNAFISSIISVQYQCDLRQDKKKTVVALIRYRC